MSDVLDQPLEVTLSDLHGMALDHEQAQEILKAAQLPAGTYVTVPPVSAYVRKSQDGRLLIALLATVRRGEVEGKVRFSISPDRRDKNGTDKPDLPSRLFAQATATVARATGTQPKTLGEVVDYVSNFPVRVRLMPGDDDPIVLAVSPVRE